MAVTILLLLGREAPYAVEAEVEVRAAAMKKAAAKFERKLERKWRKEFAVADYNHRVGYFSNIIIFNLC